MALSGSFTGTTANARVQPKITWSATQDIAGNYSMVTATLSYSRTNSGYTTAGTWSGSITINGTKKSESKYISVTQNSNTVAITNTVKVPHNSDGSKSITISCTGEIAGTGATNTNCSSTVTLDSIPREATLTSAPNFNDEENPTITYSNPAGDSVSSLQACISLTGTSADIAYRSISKTETSYTFNLTNDERTVLRNACTGNSRTVKFYVKTNIGGTDYHSILERTLSIVNANPTVTATVVDSNSATVALTGSNNTIVKYCSNAQYSITATAKKSASISSLKAECGTKSATTATGTLNAVESGTFTFTATDSRGNSTVVPINKTFVDYVKLTCNIGNDRPNATGDMTVTCSGNYFNGSFGSVANTLTVQYRYKEQSGTYGNWTAMTATKSGNTYTATASLTDLDYQKTYVFQTRAIDKINTSGVNSVEYVTNTTPIFEWGKNDFQVNVRAVMAKPMKIIGQAADNPLMVRGIVGANSTASAIDDLYLQYGTNKAIHVGNDGTYTISADGSTYSGKAANVTEKKSLTSRSHANWGTNKDYIPDMSFIAYWNGAYNGSGNSNLTYSANGTIYGSSNVLTKDFTVSVTPSTNRGSQGYGSVSIDTSSISGKKILSITYFNSSNYMLWGCQSSLGATCPSSLTIYGYRIGGTYDSAVSCTMRILYVN